METSGTVVGTIGFAFDLRFGVSKAEGVYFDVSGDDEFVLEVAADADLQASGDLGLLSLDVVTRDTDTRSETDKQDAYTDGGGDGIDFTGMLNRVSAQLSVDLTDAVVAYSGGGDGILTIAEIYSAPNPADILDADVEVSAGLHAEIVAGIAHDDQFPSIRADLYLLWLYGGQTGYALTTPVVRLWE